MPENILDGFILISLFALTIFSLRGIITLPGRIKAQTSIGLKWIYFVAFSLAGLLLGASWFFAAIMCTGPDDGFGGLVFLVNCTIFVICWELLFITSVVLRLWGKSIWLFLKTRTIYLSAIAFMTGCYVGWHACLWG